MHTRTPPAASRNLPSDSVDRRLIVAIQDRDRLAFETLYLGYYPRLARFLARFAASLENIEEIISDTFIVVWTQTRDCRHEPKVSTWIIGIAYRTAVRYLTGQRNISSSHDLPQSTYGTEDWLCHPLSRLPIQQRVTLSLAFQMGCSIEEIARVTESPIGTVESRMFHVLANLREHAPKSSLPGSFIQTEARAPDGYRRNHIELIVKAIGKIVVAARALPAAFRRREFPTATRH